MYLWLKAVWSRVVCSRARYAGILIGGVGACTGGTNSDNSGGNSSQVTSIFDEDPADRGVFGPNLISGSFGFTESEWNGLNDPNRIEQNETATKEVPVDSWTDDVSGVIISGRYVVGPPPDDNAGGLFLEGVVSSSLNFEDNKFNFRSTHSRSFYSFCGVNIHDWSAGGSVALYVNGPSGLRYSYKITGSGSANISEHDTGLSRYSVSSDLAGSFDPIAMTEPFQGLDRSREQVLVDNELYSRAFTLNVSSIHSVSYSDILFCPHIPWHSSEISLNLEVEVTPDCCPFDQGAERWCIARLLDGSCLGDPFNNCFNYALDIRSDDFKQIPRVVSGQPTCEELAVGASVYGLTQIEGDGEGAVPEPEFGECLVALYIAPTPNAGCNARYYPFFEKNPPKSDWHWVRLNQNGTWTQKTGGAPSKSVVGIPGPGHTIPRPTGCFPDYQFCSFFAVPCSTEENPQSTTPLKGVLLKTESRAAPSDGTLSITAMVYSGRSNPSWTIRSEEWIEGLYADLTDLEAPEMSLDLTDLGLSFLVQSQISDKSYPPVLIVTETQVFDLTETPPQVYAQENSHVFNLILEEIGASAAD